MTRHLSHLFHLLPLAAMASAAGAAPVPRAPLPAGTHATLAILETTDLHANVVGYDYFKLAADPSLGLDRTATLIAQARRDFPNTVLLDNGDTIQGSALGDYQAVVAPVKCGELLGIHKVMKRLGYDGGGVGNHDFNYGLGFLSQVTGNRFDVPGVARARKPCAGPGFPIVLANVVSVRTHQPLFAPYRIIEKRVHAEDAAKSPSRRRSGSASSASPRPRSCPGTSAGWKAASPRKASSRRRGATFRRCAGRAPT